MARKKKRALRWGDGTIQERRNRYGDVRYLARWYEDVSPIERVRRARTFPPDASGGPGLAEAFLREIGEKKRLGTFEPTQKMTVRELVDGYCERMVLDGRWRPSTQATNTILANRLIYPYLAERDVARLTFRHIQAWVDQLMRDGKSRSAVSTTFSLINSAMKRAVAEGTLASNPCSIVRIPSAPVRQKAAWSLEEVRRILTVASPNPKLFAMYVLLFTTGMRSGEIRALKWADLDMQSGILHIRRTITKDVTQQEYIGQSTKTAKERLVVLSADVLDALQAWRTRQIENRLRHHAWQATDVIFDRGDGQFISNVTYQKAHKDLVRSAGVQALSPHASRHTYITIEREAGEDTGIIRERVGHSSQSMQDRYTHFSGETQRQSAERTTARILSSCATTFGESDDDSGGIDAELGTRDS